MLTLNTDGLQDTESKQSVGVRQHPNTRHYHRGLVGEKREYVGWTQSREVVATFEVYAGSVGGRVSARPR